MAASVGLLVFFALILSGMFSNWLYGTADTCVFFFAVYAGNMIQLSSPTFTCQVNSGGNVPKYLYWLKEYPETVYTLQTHALYECAGGTEVDPEKCHKKGNLALSSLDWQFDIEDLDNNNDTAEFSMSAVLKTDRFSELTFRNRMSRKAGQNQFKFDIIIGNYSWVSDDPDARLVVVFSQTWDNNTFLQSAPDAFASGTVVDVSFIEKGHKKYISYAHFKGTLVHDPTFGISGNYL
jgi:hypothetical protein